ncbi:hypothetical protein CC80DRAFT_573813 [Byssothecium circinans]|uniref:Uncharacterized protein n=1 Tax=Byssothecium circinans TaxID=147558 RepID=A0A6A5TJ96_9PLEO|nr:hypothetical protein CC80DRAFT_573813 [Byssothecium circinans]
MLAILKVTVEQYTINSPNGDQAQANAPPPRTNGFRTLLENVIEANKTAVEKALKEEQHQPTEKRRNHDTDLQRWEADFQDTATWLHHLVFTPDMPQEYLRNKFLESHNPTVEDCNSDNVDSSTVANDSDSEQSQSSRDEKIIKWSEETEASIVAGRLLQSWTFLNFPQVQASKPFYALREEDRYQEASMKRLQDYAELNERRIAEQRSHGRPTASTDYTEEKQYDSLDTSSSEEEEYQSAEESTTLPDPDDFSRGRKTPQKRARADYRYMETSDDDEFPQRRQPGPHKESRKPNFGHSKPCCPPITKWRRERNPRDPQGFSYHQPIRNDNPFAAPAGTGPSSFNAPPMTAGYVPQYGTAPPSFDPYQQYIPYGSTQFPIPMPPPPRPLTPPPPPPPALPSPPPNVAKLNNDNIINRLESLLDEIAKQPATTKRDPKFDILEEQITGNIALMQEGISKDKEEIQTSKSIREAERLDRFEKILVKFGELQRKRHEESEAAWKAEKANSDAIAGQNAIEAQRLARLEIQAAEAAKEAAERALEITKERAAEPARKEAEFKAAEEKRKKEEEYERRIARYEEQFAAFTKKWEQVNEQPHNRFPVDMPLRRTCITEGERQIEISEFSKERMDPLIMPHTASGVFYQEELFDGSPDTLTDLRRPDFSANRRTNLGHPPGRERSFLRVKPSGSSQDAGQVSCGKMMLLPPNVDRSSIKTIKIQTTLDRNGIMTTFDGTFRDSGGALIRPGESSPAIIQSSIFWESPLLALGSELLGTLKDRGWKPFYVRKSDYGQTYFLGHEPIHVHFFCPEYLPQLKESKKYEPDEGVLIAKEIIEENALQEFGFPFTSTAGGVYTLDCRLAANDIEALIERSFMIREMNFRRQYRQLQWTACPSNSTDPDRQYARSIVSELTGAVSESEESNYPASTFADDELSSENSPVESSHTTLEADSGFASMDKGMDKAEEE